jgi:hypothetical protein
MALKAASMRGPAETPEESPPRSQLPEAMMLSIPCSFFMSNEACMSPHGKLVSERTNLQQKIDKGKNYQNTDKSV